MGDVALPQVACKVSRGTEHVTAAQHEANVMQKLRHPHVVRLHELLVPGKNATARTTVESARSRDSISTGSLTTASTGTNGEPAEQGEDVPQEACLVLSAALGGSLHATLSQNGPMTLNAVGLLGLQLASALAYLAAAERNVVHLDLKPANVVFVKTVPPVAHTAWQQPGRHGAQLGLQAQICDFGLCVELEGPDVKNTTIRRGTPGYVAPEVAFLKGFDCKADVFSLGCVLYEAMTGERLFHGTDRNDTYRRNAHVMLPSRFPKQTGRNVRASLPATACLTEADVYKRVHCMLSPDTMRPSAQDLLELHW